MCVTSVLTRANICVIIIIIIIHNQTHDIMMRFDVIGDDGKHDIIVVVKF